MLRQRWPILCWKKYGQLNLIVLLFLFPSLSFAHHICLTIFPDLSLYQAGTSPSQKKRWPILCVRRGRKSGQAAHSTSGFEPLVAPTHIAWEPALWRFSKQILIIRIISKLSTVSPVKLHHIFQITKALRTLWRLGPFSINLKLVFKFVLNNFPSHFL